MANKWALVAQAWLCPCTPSSVDETEEDGQRFKVASRILRNGGTPFGLFGAAMIGLAPLTLNTLPLGAISLGLCFGLVLNSRFQAVLLKENEAAVNVDGEAGTEMRELSVRWRGYHEEESNPNREKYDSILRTFSKYVWPIDIGLFISILAFAILDYTKVVNDPITRNTVFCSLDFLAGTLSSFAWGARKCIVETETTDFARLAPGSGGYGAT